LDAVKSGRKRQIASLELLLYSGNLFVILTTYDNPAGAAVWPKESGLLAPDTTMPDKNDEIEEAKGTVVPPVSESLEATINRSTKEVTLRDASGRVLTIKANVIEDEEDEEEEVHPLTPDEFRKALETVSSLGLTWTADRIPRVIAKDPEAESAFFGEEYLQVQNDYPNLPRELSAVIFHALTGSHAYESLVGNEEQLKAKVLAVRDLVLNSNYRSEFFFKYAIKVPYFETIDWEVVFKTHERNVEGMPAVAYALLLLTFHNTNARLGKINEHQNTTVAVDLTLVNKLIGLLVEVKTALEESQKLSDQLYDRATPEGDDAPHN